MATGKKNFVDFNIFQHNNKAGLPVVKTIIKNYLRSSISQGRLDHLLSFLLRTKKRDLWI
jgi:hypothetical protein